MEDRTDVDFSLKDMPKSLPKKKWNSPIARVVCFSCKSHLRPLKRIRDDKGKKIIPADYICSSCLQLGFTKPRIGNSSLKYYDYKKE